MAKKPKPKLDFLVFLTVRVVICVIQALPTGWAFGFAEMLAWFAHRVDKRHRLIARDNLRAAFPEASENQLDRLVRDCYRHFVLFIVEIALIPRKLHIENWRKFVTLDGAAKLVPALLSDRALLLVTGHFGNWEMAGFALGMLGFRTFAIARVLDNPRLERFLKRFRQATGQTIIAKNDDFKRLELAMRRGGKVATLADQDAGRRGVFVDFLNRPASAHKAVALMALEFDALMIVVGVPRTGRPLRYRVECSEVIDPRDYAGRKGDVVRAITQRYHDVLAEMIRRNPEQYFWLHRRWKTKPESRNKKPA